MRPEIMDRTDWYAYQHDHYGTTRESDFAGRQSPDELFEAQRRYGYMGSNEQMYRTGIPLEMIAGVAVSEDQRGMVISECQRAGITEVNGIPIEKFIVTAERVSDFIDIAHGRKPTKKKRIARPSGDDSDPLL